MDTLDNIEGIFQAEKIRAQNPVGATSLSSFELQCARAPAAPVIKIKSCLISKSV